MKRIRLLFAAILATSALAACTAAKEPDRGTYEEAEPTETPDLPTAPETTVAPVRPADDSVTVSSMKELVEAIRPGVVILVEPGTYNVSDFLAAAMAADGGSWIDQNEYVEVRPVYDGLELVITGVDNLTIEGAEKDRTATHFLTDPRYAAVFAFEDCTYVNLSTFTMGHTNTGDCYGSVIDFRYCEAIAVGNADLYGCGVVGLNLEYCTNYLLCNNLTIRECANGPLRNEGSDGTWEFDNCSLIDSRGSCLYDTDGLNIIFNNCKFGNRETENFMFSDRITANNCEWGEVEIYPDYPDYPDSAPGDYIPATVSTDNLSVTSFDSMMLTYPYWAGFKVIDEDTGATKETDIWAYFFSDGTGFIYEDGDEKGFDWYMDSQYGAALTFDDGTEAGAIIYTDKNAKESTTWLQLYMDGHGEWFAPLYPTDAEE